MMSKFLTIGTTLLAAVHALPSSSANKWHAIPQLARFDNDPGLPALAIAPIEIYLDIYWQGMTLVNTGASPQDSIGVTPNSRPNFAAFSALATATLTEGQPSMMTNYDDSTIDHFDLYSFYYGCSVASQASIVGIPLSCDITVKGYADDAGKQLVAEQKFGFTVDGVSSLLLGKPSGQLTQTKAQMLKATVSSKFRGLKRVDYDVSNDLLTAGLIDTVEYTVYSEKFIAN